MKGDYYLNQLSIREGFIPVNSGNLFYREVGEGKPIIIIHGGPGFDHTYLLPDMDRLADAYRLIYYDQRGRGRSIGSIENISIKNEIEDLDRVIDYFNLDSATLLGHSWGGLLAMQYAVLNQDRVSHLILLNTSPANYHGQLLFHEELRKRCAGKQEKMDKLAAIISEEGDLRARSQYYQIYFGTTFDSSVNFNKLNLSFSHMTKEDVFRVREIGNRLTMEVWENEEFTLIPMLAKLDIPALLIHSDYDFIPLEAIEPIIQSLPHIRFIMLNKCGHSSYIERPDEVHKAIDDFLG